MSCRIVLDREDGIFQPGDAVAGVVEYRFREARKIGGVKIKITGVAHTTWRQKDAKSRLVPVTGHEEYINFKNYLVGSSSGSVTMPAGLVSLPFSTVLPRNIPASFEGEWGHIRYQIKVILYRAWSIDEETESTFKVIAPLDLNEDSSLCLPRKLEVDSSFGCLCYSQGSLSMSMSLPVTGFVPGQSIPIVGECDNCSNLPVQSLYIVLRKKEYFTVHYPRTTTRLEVKKIERLNLGRVEAHESKTMNVALRVPPLAPSLLANCGLIRVGYDLQLCAEISPGSILRRSQDITIGTVPLNTFNCPIAIAASSPGAAVSDDIPPAYPGYSNADLVPPPTYEESQQAIVNQVRVPFWASLRPLGIM